jgi:hypothetical protein
MVPVRELRELRYVHTIVFVTDRRPSAAVALAMRFNANVRVLVLAPRAQSARVEQLNASWADLGAHSNATSGWDATYRQGAPGGEMGAGLGHRVGPHHPDYALCSLACVCVQPAATTSSATIGGWRSVLS